MKKIILFIGIFSLSLNAGLFSSAANAVSKHKTKEYNKGVEAYNQALQETRNDNNKKASELFAFACDKKVDDGCWNAGVLLEDYNVLLSAIYYKKSCDVGARCLLEDDKAETDISNADTTSISDSSVLPRCSNSEVVEMVEKLRNQNSIFAMAGKPSNITVELSSVRTISNPSETSKIRTCKADLDFGLDEKGQRELEEEPMAMGVILGGSTVSYALSITDDGENFYVEILQ